MIGKQKFYFPTVILTAVFIVFGVTSCAHREVDVSSPAEEVGKFSTTGSDTVSLRWWETFEDPILDHFLANSFRGNLSLRQAYNRLEEAQARLEKAQSGLYPSVDVRGSYGVEKAKDASSSQSGSLSLAAGYELDLWGKIESSAEAANFETRATRQDLRAAAVSLSAEATLTWFQLVEKYSQKYLLQDQIETNKQILKLQKKRFQYGSVRSSDILRQRSLISSNRQRLESIRASIQVLEHKFAVLQGKLPSRRINPVRTSLPEIPPFPKTGIPARVINRRPDVRSAFLKVKAADRQVAAALARRYPRFSIDASISTRGGDAATLFDNWLQSVAANLALPLLDGGGRRAEVTRSKKALVRQINSYRETVLNAYKEVEDAIEQEKQVKEQLKHTQEQLKDARQTLVLLKEQYFNGTAGYLEVLETLKSKQQLQRDLMTSRRELLESRVGLYRALAGGFKVGEKLTKNNLD